jgi:crossover junction endodeoxyribonuclease RuvC
MLIVGIDPGISGAIAAVTPSGSLQWVHDMPVRDAGKKTRKANEIDGVSLARLLRVHVADIGEVWIEEVSAMPGQGVSSMFSLGDSRGCIRGVCEALGLSTQRVHPTTWKRSCGLLGADKGASRAMAIRLYPGCDVLARKKDHGRAEAILLARYGAQQSRLADSFLGTERPALELVA